VCPDGLAALSELRPDLGVDSGDRHADRDGLDPTENALDERASASTRLVGLARIERSCWLQRRSRHIRRELRWQAGSRAGEHLARQATKGWFRRR